MFVRVKKIGPYEYLYLVENAREGGRHVQRVVKALGRRDQMENSDLLDGLILNPAAVLIWAKDLGPPCNCGLRFRRAQAELAGSADDHAGTDAALR